MQVEAVRGLGKVSPRWSRPGTEAIGKLTLELY